MLTIMRHAHTTWNGPPKRIQGRADVAISEMGRSRATILQKKMGLDLVNYSLIVSSPALRCKQTLEVLFSAEQIETFYDDRLWEIDMGIFTGLLESEAVMKYPELWYEWRNSPAIHKIKNGGSLQELLDHALNSLMDIVSLLNTYRNILVMTHGGIIRILKCYIENLSLNDFHRIKVQNLDIFQCDVEIINNKLKFNSFNKSTIII